MRRLKGEKEQGVRVIKAQGVKVGGLGGGVDSDQESDSGVMGVVGMVGVVGLMAAFW